MQNADIAHAFRRIAAMLEIRGENPFRVRAYREAARTVEGLAEPVAALVHSGADLSELPGIGKDLAGKIQDLAKTGTTPLYEELRKKIPIEVADLTELQGLGPKRVKILFEQLGVRGREDLEAAARAGKVRELPGLGETVEKNILKALETAKTSAGRTLLAGAWGVAHAIAEHVAKARGIERLEVAGSFRRRRETVGDLDVLAIGPATSDVMKRFTTYEDVAEVLAHGETKSSVRLRNGLQVDLRLVPEDSFGACLLYFTGSKEHNIELRKMAQDQGLKLNEYGLFRGEKRIAGRTEVEMYRALGLPYIEPELREARGEIEAALAGRLPKLIEEKDLRADLHLHTNRTDGKNSLREMVEAAKRRGYDYVAITDHTQALAMMEGFDEARVRRSVEEVAEVRRQVPGIEVLHGMEVDIRADGSLDLDDATLDLLDLVIVAIHSRLEMPGPQMTERVLAALSNPRVHVLGHPTGRLIGTRKASALDLEKVVEFSARNGVALEINAQPDRTDLNDVNARLAKERGVKLVIDTDAHSTNQLDFIRYGVFAARRAWLEKGDVLNTLPPAGFRKALRRHAAAPAKRKARVAAARTSRRRP
jgi:DNA polymerase (family 10)